MFKFEWATVAPVSAALVSLLLSACGGDAPADSASEVGAARGSASAPSSGTVPKSKPVPTAPAAAKPAASAASTSSASASVQDPPPSHAQSYTVSPNELIRNGLYANGLTDWSISDAVLVSSTVRSGAKALNVGSHATQALGIDSLSPRKSYTLTVKARNDQSNGTTQILVRFRRAVGGENFRTYKTTVSSTAFEDYRVSFTAPEYAAIAEVSIAPAGTRVVVDSVSLKMRSAIDQTEPITSSVGSHVPAGYALAFNDEFNGTELNRSKWFTRYVYSGETLDHLNDEKERYRDNDNHRVSGGALSLIARKVSGTEPDGANYESGMIRSDWTTRYGYFEARVKMPGGVGVWPAFWLNSDVSSTGKLSWPPEIDIFEFVNNGVEDKVNMLHSNVVTQGGPASKVTYADSEFKNSLAEWWAPFDFDAGWHTIGAEWTPDSVTLFVDGKKIYTRGYTWTYVDGGGVAGPAHILLNLAIGGSWAGRHGIEDSAFPQALQIDWVRAYQKTD